MKIRTAGTGDAAPLAALCRKTFTEAYWMDNTAENMALYLDAHFTEPLIQAELEDPQTLIFVADLNGILTGYLVLKKIEPPPGVSGRKPIEIARFYVDKDHQGLKVGSALMKSGFQWAKQEGFDVVWLTVWKQNLKAMNIYQHLGFAIAGETTFVLGEDVQFDYIMQKPL